MSNVKKYLPQTEDGLFLRGNNTWTTAEEQVLKITTTRSDFEGRHVTTGIAGVKNDNQENPYHIVRRHSEHEF